MDLSCCESFYIFEVLLMHVLLLFLKWGSIGYSLGIVQWDFTRRDHPGNPGKVSGSGLVTVQGRLCPIFVSRIGLPDIYEFFAG